MVIWAIAGCSRLIPTAEDHYQRAEQYLASGNYDLAVLELRRALAIKPHFPEAHFRLGWIMFHIQGDVKGAMAEFRTAIEQGYSHPAVHYELGAALLEAEFYDDALEQFNRAIESDYDTAQVRLDRGRAWLGKGELEKAEQEFLMAVERHKPVEFPLAYYYLGEVYQQQKKIAQAITAYQTYVQIMTARLETLAAEQREAEGEIIGAPPPIQDMPDIETVKQRIAALQTQLSTGQVPPR
ncbi:MAG TPA: tetratricopeptide repeat protein [Blastocatellia bacterium]|nr:tetratricopeptide repeat protein [Blastocatellia bacterium]